MARRLSRGIVALAVAASAACACQETAAVQDPHAIGAWVGACEDRCHQQHSCDLDQFLFDHGNLDNCTGDCAYFLETATDEQLVDEVDDACLEALWAEVRCVYGLGCDDLQSWEDGGASAPCADEGTARAAACAGIDLDDFLLDCGWPQSAPA